MAAALSLCALSPPWEGQSRREDGGDSPGGGSEPAAAQGWALGAVSSLVLPTEPQPGRRPRGDICNNAARAGGSSAVNYRAGGCRQGGCNGVCSRQRGREQRGREPREAGAGGPSAPSSTGGRGASRPALRDPQEAPGAAVPEAGWIHCPPSSTHLRASPSVLVRPPPTPGSPGRGQPAPSPPEHWETVAHQLGLEG